MDKNGLLVLSRGEDSWFAVPIARIRSVRVNNMVDDPAGNKVQVTVDFTDGAASFVLQFKDAWYGQQYAASLRKNYQMALENRY